MIGDAERYRNAGNAPLLDLLPAAPPGGRVLDCGCGPGDNARLLTTRGWTVSGITIDAAEQRTASAYCDAVYLADLEQGLPPALRASARFQVILMSHVLEHLVHPERLLADAHTVLAPGGVLAVALPNIVCYPERIKLLLGRFEYTSVGVLDESHVRFYTFVTAQRLLTSNGFRILRACADGGVPLWRVRQHLPTVLVRWLNRQATRRWPGLFGFQSLFLASPRG